MNYFDHVIIHSVPKKIFHSYDNNKRIEMFLKVSKSADFAFAFAYGTALGWPIL